jgi:hypothetical protein
LNSLEPEHDASLNHQAGALQLLFSIEDSTAATTSSDSVILDTFESPETFGEEAGLKHEEGFL